MERFKSEAEKLSISDQHHFQNFISGDGLLAVERIVRGRLARAIVEAGEAAVALQSGLDGAKFNMEEQTKLAVKYQNFLEVIDEIRKNKEPNVEKLRNI